MRGEPIEFPTAEAVVPAFMREVGDVHRELYAENGELYGENIRGKVERCIAVTDAEYAAAVRARDELRERAEEALDGFDVLVTPVLSCPVPPADCEEIEVRAAMTLYTFPFNALGWPALRRRETSDRRPSRGRRARARGGTVVRVNTIWCSRSRWPTRRTR